MFPFLGNFCEKFCRQDILKIVQSSHTDANNRSSYEVEASLLFHCYLGYYQCDQIWQFFWTLSIFSKPLATINLAKSLTFLGNFGKGVKIFNFSCEIMFRATFIDIWRFFTGHTGYYPR